MSSEARRVVTVEKGTEWEDGFARPRVVLQPFAAPSVLGFQYDAPVIVHWNLPNPATAEGNHQ